MAIVDERLPNLLRENIHTLKDFTTLFDRGNEAIAKDMAVKIRVLLHDTAQSASLLGQLGYKNSLSLVNTAPTIKPENLFPSWGLVYLRTRYDGENPYSGYEAPLGHLPPSRQLPNQGFEEWWTNKIIKDVNGTQLSRKDLVLILSNKEGGAHVDPQQSQNYKDITLSNTLGANVMHDDNLEVIQNKPIEHSVRQITYELLKTFDADKRIVA